MRRVIVANRGEIARRVFRTCRLMGLSTVAVYSEPDRMSPHVRDADLSVPLGGETPTESYLDIDKQIEAAAASHADAVHPGYGFLAENASFAERVIDAGLTWIGPPPAAIRAMALKIEAKALAAAAGVPLLPGAELTGEDPARWHELALAVGYPVLVKASAGGGGKGMRVVTRPEDLVESVRAGRREAQSSFGDPTVFIERFLSAPRHVEVQVVADQLGNVLHLLDRDCSLQRRHQKVVEEAPAPGLSADLRRSMREAAVLLTRSIGYRGVGTLEFLVADDDFYFLEMNTRLQVEHPVTEEITGLDLVRLQLEVADGRPLALAQDDVATKGHAIEARLYAEDPSRDFLPSIGTLSTFEPTDLPGVRWEAGVVSGSAISPFYDPMLAKVVAHAPTRAEAARRLVGALRQLHLAGLRTNRNFLIAALDDPGFVGGEVSTSFFGDRPGLAAPIIPPAIAQAAFLALAVHLRRRTLPRTSVGEVIPGGWRSLPAVAQRWQFLTADGELHHVDLDPPAHTHQAATIDGERLTADIVPAEGPDVDLVLNGVRRRFRIDPAVEGTHAVSCPEWSVDLTELSAFGETSAVGGASGTTSPLPGVVVAVLVQPGDEVREGQDLVVLEAMKMEHPVRASHAGRVAEVLVAVGDRVDAHGVLLTLDTAEP